MKIRELLGMTVVFVVVWSSFAYAQQHMVGTGGEATVVVRGAGSESCGSFMSASAGLPPGQVVIFTSTDGHPYHGASDVYAEWIQGYISGYNSVAGPDVARQVTVDYAGTDLWIRQFCQANPADTIATATTAFIRSRLPPPQMQFKPFQPPQPMETTQ